MGLNLLSVDEEEAIIGIFDGTRIEPDTLAAVQQVYRRLVERREIREALNAQSQRQGRLAWPSPAS